MSKVTKRFHVPTHEEVRVMVMAARRAQAEEMFRLVRLAAKGVKALVVRAVKAIVQLRNRQRTIARHGA